MTQSIGGDRITLRALQVECIIGFIEWERRVKQTIEIDLDLPIDCRHAALTDDVANTLDYQEVANRIRQFVSQSEFNLLETLAERMAQLILADFGSQWVRIAVRKLGSLPGLREAEVVVERVAADCVPPKA